MSATDGSLLGGFTAPREAGRYDGFTILLHWLTAALVLILFGTAYYFNNFARPRTPLRHELQLIHVGFGIALAAVFIVRVIWRATGGRRLPAATADWHGALSKTVHWILYLLLTAQVVLGFLYRWAQGEEFTFFGLFAVPPLFAPNRPWARSFDSLHYYVGWTIFILACAHAVAALTHHYVLKDGVLRRMTGQTP